MADIEGLNLVIGAKVDQAVSGLNQVQQGLAKTAVIAQKTDSSLQLLNQQLNSLSKSGTSLFTLTEKLKILEGAVFTEKDVAKIAKFNAQIENTKKEIDQLSNVGKTGFDKLGNSIEKVGNPLAKAFSGLRQIAYIIPGIGIAGIFDLAFQAIAAVAGQLFNFSAASAAAVKANEEFKKSLRDAETGVLGNTLSLQAFVRIARDSTKPLAERNEALREANKILGEHGEKLTLVNINTAAATVEINKFTEALIAQALAAKYADKIADLLITQRERIKDVTEAQKGLNIATERAAILLKGDIGQRGVAQAAVDLHNSALRNLIKATTDYKDTTKDLNTQSAEFNSLIEKSTDLFGQLGIKSKDAEKNINAIAELLRKLAIARDELSNNPLVFNLDKPLKDIELLQAAIKRLRELKAPEAIIIKLQVQIDNEALAAVGGQLEKQFGTLKNFKLPDISPPPIKISAYIDFSKIDNDFAELKGKVEALSDILKIKVPVNFEALNEEELKKLLKQLQSKLAHTDTDFLNIPATTKNFEQLQGLAKDTAKLFDSVLGPAFTSAFDALANGENVFQAIGNSLKQMITKMIAAAAEAAVLSLVIGLVTGEPVNFGAVFSQLAGIPKFDEGGITTGTTLGILHSKEAVLPLERLQEFININNKMEPVVLDTKISGSDLLLLQRRAERNFNRSF